MKIVIILMLMFLSSVSVFAQKKGETSTISPKKNQVEIVFSNDRKQICSSYQYLKIGNDELVLIHYVLSSGTKVSRTYPRAQIKYISIIE